MTRSPAYSPPHSVPTELRSGSQPPELAAAGPHTRHVGLRSGWAMRGVYFASDAAAIAGALAASQIAANLWQSVALGSASVLQVKLLSLLAAGLLAAGIAGRTYAAIPPRPVRQFRSWVLGSAAVLGTLLTLLSLLEIGSAADYVVLAAGTFLAVLTASFFRAVCRIVLGSASWWGTRLIVIGNGPLVAKALASIEREPQWGLRAVGYVDEGSAADGSAASGRYLGSLEQLDELAAEHNVAHALLAVDPFDADELAALLARSSAIQHWLILPPLDQFPSLWLEECEAARLPALTVTNRLTLPWSRAAKRAMDLIVTCSLGLLALPLVALLAGLVRLSSPGPIFYGQERIGRHGRRFRAWKFRTMFQDADVLLARHLEDHPDLAAQWAAKHKLLRDPRVTWAGRWLRLTSLDELPQVWNVIVGEMSLVGPRPIVSAEIDKYADRYEDYVKVLPGITGLWQVSGRNNTTYEERVDLDVYYVRNWSLWLDIYIAACTVKVVLLGEGAY